MAARAEGDALLKAAHAEDLFVNETVGPAILLRHRASGFRCVFNPGKPQNKVVVFRSLTRGDDVGCVTDTISDARELFFTRAPERTPEQALAEDIRVVKMYDPGAQLYTPPPAKPLLPAPPGADTPQPLAASLKGGREGGHRLVVGKVGEWLVDFRFQGAPEVADLGPVLDTFWLNTVFEARRSANVTASQAPPNTVAAPLATPSTPAVARAEAETILARADVRSAFENVTTGKLPELRHMRSGFVCTFEPGAPDNAVMVYPNPSPGDDISCTTRSAGAITTRFVTRFPIVVTADQALAVYLAEIKRAHPDVQAASGPFANVTGNRPSAPPQPVRRTARLTYTMNGQTAFSRVSVAIVNGWVLEQRLTVAIKDAAMIDLMGELFMIADVAKFSAANSPPPAPSKPPTT